MSFVRKGFLSLTGSLAQALISFLTGILLARALNPDGLGQYSLVVSLVTILGTAGSLGLGNASIFYINNKKWGPGEIVQVVARLSLILALAAFIASAGIFQFEGYFGEMTSWSIVFVAVYGFGVVMLTNLLMIPLAFMNVNQFVLARIVPGSIFICLVGFSYFDSGLSAHDAWLYIAIGQTVGVLLLVFFIKEYLKERVRIDFAAVKDIAAYGSKMNLAYIALLLHSEIGLFLVRFFTDDFAEVGYYRLSIRLAGILLILPKSIGPLFFSRWSKITEDVRLLEVERVSRLFYLATFAGIVLIELIADDLITSLYGPAYIRSVPILKVILLGVGIRFVLMPAFSLFSSSGTPLFTTYVYLVGLFVTVLLMCVLIPVLGGLGAGMAFTAGYIVALLVCYYLAHGYLGLDIRRCFLVTPGDLRFLRDKLSGTS